VVAATCLIFTQAIRSQSSGAAQQLELTTPQGKRTAVLRVPPGAGRVPVVVLVSSGNPEMRSELVDALGSRGIATLRVDLDQSTVASPDTFDDASRDLAAWITRLRNDSRFERIMVAGLGYASRTAMKTARAARADGLILLGPADYPQVVVKQTVGASIPVTIELDRDPIQKLVQFVRGTSIPRHPEGERRSPRDVVMADIAGSRIAIEYGRPSKRGRVIWGTLVPWGRWWMPGADEGTTVTTSKDLTFGTLAVPAGDYTIYTQPSDGNLQLIINRETGLFHTVYRSERDLGRVEMKQTPTAASVEQLTFAVEPSEGGGVLKMIWDDREYAAPFVVSR
jgi:pimeloyl-ACP methyl ester carboxylesterase